MFPVSQGTNISHTQERGGHFHIVGDRDKHFYIEQGGQTFLHHGGWDKHFMLLAMMMLMKKCM